MLVRTILLLLLFLFLARAIWRLLEGVARGAAGPDTKPGSGAGRTKGVKMAQCPACGTYVVPGTSISDIRGGHTVYFCSERCRDAA